ncbi:MAG: epoxyqueuosine reductase QueH [Candidatus Omnitrophota bacterium]|nr:epoxyqueuosine reductase QueH [Candidatus Omnitrophota bacterium]
MKLLLHICCGPCLIYPLENLRSKGFEVSGIFYNPNIHGYIEYANRKKAVEEISRIKDLNTVYAEYDLQNYFRAIVGNEEKNKRCPICWNLRLKRVAKFAQENNFEYFSTTLLVSPYQDIEIIKKIGDDIEKNYKIKFYFEDFRPGFKTAHDEAKKLGLYCQKYCGCVYSEAERHARNK